MTFPQLHKLALVDCIQVLFSAGRFLMSCFGKMGHHFLLSSSVRKGFRIDTVCACPIALLLVHRSLLHSIVVLKHWNHCSRFFFKLSIGFIGYFWLSRYIDGLRDGRQGFDFWKAKKFFSTPQRPDRLWGQPSIISNGTGRTFRRGKAAEAWNWLLTSI
jgi:hypothetical protein